MDNNLNESQNILINENNQNKINGAKNEKEKGINKGKF